jgi:hypothetical protein
MIKSRDRIKSKSGWNIIGSVVLLCSCNAVIFVSLNDQLQPVLMPYLIVFAVHVRFSLGVGDSITRLLMSVETETSCCCFYHLPLSHREQCFCFPSALNGLAQKTLAIWWFYSGKTLMRLDLSLRKKEVMCRCRMSYHIIKVLYFYTHKLILY